MPSRPVRSRPAVIGGLSEEGPKARVCSAETHGQAFDVQQDCMPMWPDVSGDGSREQVWSAWYGQQAAACLSKDGSKNVSDQLGTNGRQAGAKQACRCRGGDQEGNREASIVSWGPDALQADCNRPAGAEVLVERTAGPAGSTLFLC